MLHIRNWQQEASQDLRRHRRQARRDRVCDHEERKSEQRAREAQMEQFRRLLEDERELFRQQTAANENTKREYEREAAQRQSLNTSRREDHAREVAHRRDLWDDLRRDFQQDRDRRAQTTNHDEQRQQQMQQQWAELLRAFQAQLALRNPVPARSSGQQADRAARKHRILKWFACRPTC